MNWLLSLFLAFGVPHHTDYEGSTNEWRYEGQLIGCSVEEDEVLTPCTVPPVYKGKA